MSLIDSILQRLKRWQPKRVFSRTDFLDLGTTDAIGMTLMRLERKGKIRRVRRGYYDQPINHPELGLLSPSPEELARAIARREGTRLATGESEAANLLHLSEQVPAKMEYLTDGRGRTLRLGRGSIRFRQRSPRRLAGAGRMSGLVFAALRNLGKTHVTKERIAHLRELLREPDRRRLLKDLRYAPAWMHPHLRYIAEKEKST